jgi:hypothetical protein
MAEIAGYWEFHRSCPAEDMTILGIDSAGAFVDSSINNVSITGQYDANTNAISFNDARRPGSTLFVSFYTGYVIPTGEGGVCAMAGTFQEAELVFEEGGLDGERDLGAPGPGIRGQYTTLHAAWYAIWKAPIIE